MTVYQRSLIIWRPSKCVGFMGLKTFSCLILITKMQKKYELSKIYQNIISLDFCGNMTWICEQGHVD